MGSHLLLHYYFNKEYPNEFNALPYESDNSVFDENGIIDFNKFYILFGLSKTINTDDITGRALANSNYPLSNSATTDEAKAAYGISSLFMMIEGIDLDDAKENLAAYAYLKYLSQRTFVLNARRLNLPNNQFSISLPDSVTDDSEHGTLDSIVWSWDASGILTSDIQNSFPTALSNITNTNEQLSSFNFDIQTYADLRKDGALKVTVTYQDGFAKSSDAQIDYLPQHNNVTLSTSVGSYVNEGDPITFIVFVDGESPDSVVLCQSNTAYGFKQYDVVLQPEGSDNTYTFTFSSDTSAKGMNGYSISVDKHCSESLIINVVDGNDTDFDGLPDDWEIKYFGTVELCDPFDDADGDEKSNYAEWKNSTDPTKTGVAEIIATEVFESYKDWNGHTVSTFHPYGSIYANVELKSGTLDLNGRMLIIHGNFLHSGGTLKVNGGNLIVKGDYRIQKLNEDSTYSCSNGFLIMTNATDRIIVEGDFVMDSKYSHGSYLKEGILELHGNFAQKLTWTGSGYGTYNNFHTNENHKVFLSGTGLQTVSFKDVGHSCFNILEITNSSEDGIKFATPIIVTTLNTNGNKLSGLFIKNSNWKLEKNDVIQGNLQISYGTTLDLDGRTLTIHGNFLHTGETLLLNGGTLIVKGDYKYLR